MSSEATFGYRIKADGADETIQKLRDLAEATRTNSIAMKDAREEHKELTFAAKYTVSEHNDIKNAIAAANPNLLEFTRTMSSFGAVANTAMATMNAINLAMIAGSQVTQELAGAQRQAASDYNDYVREREAYGLDDPRTQAALAKYKEDINEITNLQKEQARQTIDTAITQIVSATAIAGSISQQYLALKAIQWDKVFDGLKGAMSGALASVTWFAGTILLPLAAGVAAFYGAYYLIRALNPLYGQSMDELANIIQNNWHVSSIEAQLVAPFVGAYLGMAKIEDDISTDLYNFVNGMINLVNTVPNAVNNAFGRIVIPTISNVLPPGFADGGQNSFYNQAIHDLNIGGINTATNPNAYGISGAVPNLTTDQVRQQLESMVQSGTKTATNSETSLTALSGIGSYLSENNDTLHMINSGVAGLLQPLTDQKVASAQLKDSLNNQIIQLKQSIADLSLQPQTTLYAQHFDPDTGAPIYTAGPSDAANQLAQAKQQLAQAQSIISGLDNATSGLAPVLQSIGLSGDTGIGSVISSALGGAAGLGGAGISAGELQYFAQTGDYGVFTAAAKRENGVSSTPTRQDQINALLNSWKQSGLSGYTAADAAKALGYGGSSSGSNNYDPTGGSFGSLPGQYGRPSANITVNVTNQGSILAQSDFENSVHQTVKTALQLVGW